MKHIIISSLFCFVSQLALAQSAEMELDKLYGECTPQYIAFQDSLVVYSSPDLRSTKSQIKYQQGWHVPYSSGKTRVLEMGKVIQLNQNGENSSYEYLYDLGEGYAKLRKGEEEYELPVSKSKDFKIESKPKIQTWIKVEHKDKTSPGWLLLESEQVRVHKVLC